MDLRSFIQELPSSIPEEHTSTHAEHLHDLNSRTYWSISRGSPRSSLKDLYRGFHQDPDQIFSQGIVKTLAKIFTPGPLQKISQNRQLLEKILHDLDTRTSRQLPTKTFMQAPLTHGMCKIFMQGPPTEDLARISTRSSVKDVFRTLQGPFREDLNKIFSYGPVPENVS